MKRERLYAIIRALAAKTVENGCTEEEAMSAASKLADMLAEHNITLDEAQLRETPFARHREEHADGVGARLWKVADGAAFLTGATYWTADLGAKSVIHFFGFEHEVEVAKYLLEICAHAMRSERARLRKEYALLRPETQRRKIVPFLDGMADSLRLRLRALKPKAPTGTGLVVLRGELIAKAMAEEGIKIKPGSAGRRSRDFEASYRDGVEAAQRVALNPGLAGADALRRLK